MINKLAIMDKLPLEGFHAQKINYLFSYRRQQKYADDELCFVGWFGLYADHITIIQFIVNTIDAYKNLFK